MTPAALAPVDCRYGAPMGRASRYPLPSFDGALFVERVKLDSDGYDDGGAYWGVRPRGESLWLAHGDDGYIAVFFDAPSTRAAAVAKARELAPHATIRH